MKRQLSALNGYFEGFGFLNELVGQMEFKSAEGTSAFIVEDAKDSEFSVLVFFALGQYLDGEFKRAVNVICEWRDESPDHPKYHVLTLDGRTIGEIVRA